jgi:hypothetical protein
MNRLSIAVVAVLVAVTGCATPRALAPGQSLADIEATLGPARERRQVGNETWLYYPNQPFKRQVHVARVGPDGRLIAVEQRLTYEYVAKLIPNQSRSDDVLDLFGHPYERLNFPRMDRDAWTWHMRLDGNTDVSLNVQMSPDGVVREVYVLDENNRNDGKKR